MGACFLHSRDGLAEPVDLPEVIGRRHVGVVSEGIGSGGGVRFRGHHGCERKQQYSYNNSTRVIIVI